MVEAVGDVRTERERRAEHILDTAADLLLRHGYRRVTIDDVARSAGVGKGTLYLHWRSREELFLGVLLREMAELLDELVECLRTEPADVLPHRMGSLSYLAAMRRPLTRAMFVPDVDMLGKLVHTDAGQAVQARKTQINLVYYRTLMEYGLVRPELTLDQLVFGVSATNLGFYSATALLPSALDISVEDRAASLAHVLRSAFEAPDALDHPDLTTVAEQLVREYTRFRDVCRVEALGRGREVQASTTKSTGE
ncbi:TetR/AcrR family transcriptional regulator [Streptoalloteichus hindustanus]|uniref:Transcriptional regulator, TetR family n=1 Tax=Streptoalloteichus hindustanus TaxID=2017 RepID=A0A1M4XMK8_STRHI|nr:TetR/AcrR family transcriptional regulator [Streptoalloteichus hindustanus]SHE94648.1 transcriptional regulator, TetR family [Streptoalloteichus hindustanus]